MLGDVLLLHLKQRLLPQLRLQLQHRRQVLTSRRVQVVDLANKLNDLVLLRRFALGLVHAQTKLLKRLFRILYCLFTILLIPQHQQHIISIRTYFIPLAQLHQRIIYRQAEQPHC